MPRSYDEVMRQAGILRDDPATWERPAPRLSDLRMVLERAEETAARELAQLLYVYTDGMYGACPEQFGCAHCRRAVPVADHQPGLDRRQRGGGNPAYVNKANCLGDRLDDALLDKNLLAVSSVPNSLASSSRSNRFRMPIVMGLFASQKINDPKNCLATSEFSSPARYRASFSPWHGMK